MRLIGVAVAVALLAGCTTASSGGHVVPNGSATPPVTTGTVSRQLAALDHTDSDRAYVTVLHQLHRRCRANSPSALRQLATAGYRALTSHGVAGASYLAVLRSLSSGSVPTGSARSCSHIGRDFAAEVEGTSHPSTSYGGYAATTAAWAAAHHADPAHPGGYLPKLANGDDSEVIAGNGRVTTLTRSFDPPLSQQIAISVVRKQLLPGGLHSVYTLPTSRCYEVVYLSPRLGRLLSSSALGVMIELTSGHGISSHYDDALVDRAILTVGGRIGGQPSARESRSLPTEWGREHRGHRVADNGRRDAGAGRQAWHAPEDRFQR